MAANTWNSLITLKSFNGCVKERRAKALVFCCPPLQSPPKEEWVLGAAVGRLDDDCREAMHAVVSVVRSVVKLFLYVGPKNARRAEHNDLHDALKWAKGLGRGSEPSC